MKKSKIMYTLFGMGIPAAAYLLLFGARTLHNIQRKQGTVNTYAIRNANTDMAIRVYNAGIPDETKIIQYKHQNWECMTWQLIEMEDGSFLLKNLYTHKTFQPSASPEQGVDLWQQPLEANSLQYWEFIKQSDETYQIRLRGTELYITPTSDESNASLVLMPLQDGANQQWVLIEQHPIV